MAIEAGQTLSHYRLIEKIGEGGMGVVYRAEDLHLEREVAVKVLPPEMLEDAGARRRFRKEALALSRLNHPNVESVYEFDSEDDIDFLVMEYVPGESLDDRLRAGALTNPEVVEIGRQLAEGLHSVHEENVIHGDLKPANIRMTPNGQVKILDFGLARLIRPTSDSSTLKEQHRLAGTLPYMAPEQLTGSRIDVRTDIYSTGAVLYEMATGRQPYSEDSVARVVHAILHEEPMRPRQANPDVDPDVERVILRTIDKDPGRRFPTASDLRDSLEHLIQGRFVPLPAASGRPVFGLWLVVAVGVFLALTVAGFLRPEAVPPAPAEPSRPIVALFGFENNTGDPNLGWLYQGIPDMLATNLSRSPYLQLLGLDLLADHAERVGSDSRRGASRLIASEIGKNAGADIVITGSIVQIGERFRIMAQLYDLESDRLIKGESAEGPAVGSVLEMAEELARRIRMALEIEASGELAGEAEIALAKTDSVEAYKFYVLGRDLLNRHYFDDAIVELRRATDADSCFAHAYDLLANAYDVLGDVELAEGAIDRAIECSTRLAEPDRLRMLRRQAQIDGDLEAELGYLRQLVLLEADRADWHLILGWFHSTHLRSCETSIHEYTKGLAIDPRGQPDYYGYLGDAYFACDRPADALETLETYRSIRPEDADAHWSVGNGLQLTGDIDESLAAFRQALELKPDYFYALHGLGNAYLALGRVDEAIAHHERCLATAVGTNQQETARAAIARTHLRAERIELALEHADRALAIDADSQEALWVRGLALVRGSRLADADAVLTRLRTLQEESGSLHEAERSHDLAAEILAARGDRPAAIEALTSAVALEPVDRPYYLNRLARAYLENGDTESASDTANAVLAFNTSDPEAHWILGKIQERQHEYADALTRYRRVLVVWSEATLPMAETIRARVDELETLLP